MIEGLDVSNWQGLVNWPAVKRAGAEFAICKAYEGMYGPDPTFPRNWSKMALSGLVRGCYHFLRPSMDGAAQAHAAHMYVHNHGGMHGHDFVALDLEVTDGAPAASVILQAERFVEYVFHSWHRQCVIYTGAAFWEELGSPHSELLATCPLWIASWGVSTPPLFGPWRVWSFWQYTGGGSHAGVHGPVDLDRFNGNYDQLLAVTEPR